MVYDHNDNSPVLTREQRRNVQGHALEILADIAEACDGRIFVVTMADAVCVINYEEHTMVRACHDAEDAVHTLIARELVMVAWNNEIPLQRRDADHIEGWAFPLQVTEVGTEVLEVLGLIVD
jgi:hypothetical protein